MKPQATRSNELVALDKWLTDMGRSRITGWRWRKLGWLDVVNISGRPYVTCQAIQKFKERAQSGEFAKQHKAPKRSCSALP